MNKATGFQNGGKSATGFCNELGGSYSHGLTKRELIAAMCLQGLLANPECYKISSEKLHPDEVAEFYSICSVEQADELLKQLENQ